MTMGLASQTVLPMSSSGSSPGGAFGVIEAAGGIHRAVDLDAVLAADYVIFLPVPGSGMDRAGALFQRDVIGQNAERIALEERVVEDRAFELRAGKAGDRLRSRSSRTFRAVTFSSSAATM